MRTIRNIRHGLAVAIIALAGNVFGIGAPTGLSVAPIDYTQAACNIDCSAKLSWTAPAEGAATGYKIYRRIAAAETPTLAGTVDGATTSFTDLTATVGQLYLYTVTAVDADGESAESDAVSYRKVENVATKANGAFSNAVSPLTSGWGNYSLDHLNDGNVGTAARLEGAGWFNYVFGVNNYIIAFIRAYADASINSGSNYQKLVGLRNSVSDSVDMTALITFASRAWSVHKVQDSLVETRWIGLGYGGGAGYPILCELEAYGYQPSLLLTVPSGLATEIVDNQVSLSWSAGANASSYKVYRKTDGGEWEVVASDVTGNSYTDESVERGNTYIYRVAAVSAAGDELSSSERSAFVPAGAQVWWNFLNVKSIAYPGAAAWPANPRPHFLSRDRAGTTLLAAMSTDHGGVPVMTFDLQALVDGDGELLSRDTKAKSWWIWGKDAYTPWQDKGFCWKGAAATEDLIFWANGTPNSSVAVVNRADDSEDIYTLRAANGNLTNFWMNGGVAASADGKSIYSNCGAEGEKNKIIKFTIDREKKFLRLSEVYPVEGITYIRNFAVYTVGGTELAVFGEGEGEGKLGVLDLSTGVSTVRTASEITGQIANVKLADTEDGLFLVAQNDDGFVAVYAFNAAEKKIALVKKIEAATMKALYGAAGDFECRNLEMTADGRYAFILCNGGADTRLSVIGATLKTIPETAPESFAATADMSTLWQAKLSWANAADVTATGIRVLRAQTGKPGYAVVADLPLGTTEYTDTSAVGGVDYTYAVAYINSFEGKTVAGPAATAACTPWQSLMPYKKQVVSTKAVDDFKTVFDGRLDTQSSTANNDPVFGLQFSEPLVFGVARMLPIGWAASMGRLDSVIISGGAEGSVSLSGSAITATSGLVQLAQTGTPRAADWFDVPSGDTTSAWTYLLLSRVGSWIWYGDLCEVEFYGAVKSLKDAAVSKPSEAAATVAPALSANAGTLTWTDEPDETVAVVIYRSRMAEGPYVRIAEVAPGIGRFTDSEASTEVRYYYRAAFVTEYHGVNLDGVQSAAKDMVKPIVLESVLLTENGVSPSAKTYGYAVKRAGGVPLSDAEKAFDGLIDTTPLWYDAPNYGKNVYVGYNFNEPVKVTKAKVVTFKGGNSWDRVTLRVSSDLAYLENPSDTSYWFPNNNPDALTWGGAFSPKTCTVIKTFDINVADKVTWEQSGLSTDWTRCAYLWSRADMEPGWWGAVREFELWGYTESMWQAVQPKKVVQPVENLAARMDDTTLTLNWTLANDAATAITVKHRVSGGAWAEVASLAGTATSLVTETVAVGRYNEYRIEVSDGTEIVWNEKDFAICPLLAKGTRTVLGCTATSAYDYLDVAPSAAGFSATVEFAGASQTALGLTPGTGNGATVNFVVRKDLATMQTVELQRHFVYGNTLGLYVYDPNYATHWASEGNAATRFRIVRSAGKTYQLGVAGADGAWANTAPYAFAGDDRIGKGACLVGVTVADPNLASLPQIAPCTIKIVVHRGMAIIVR